jgi:hypothetical protein
MMGRMLRNWVIRTIMVRIKDYSLDLPTRAEAVCRLLLSLSRSISRLIFQSMHLPVSPRVSIEKTPKHHQHYWNRFDTWTSEPEHVRFLVHFDPHMLPQVWFLFAGLVQWEEAR